MAKRRNAEQSEEQMNRKCVRLYIDRSHEARLDKVAQLEQRDKNRQLGVILERVSALCKDAPQELVRLGILSPMAAQQAAAL